MKVNFQQEHIKSKLFLLKKNGLVMLYVVLQLKTKRQAQKKLEHCSHMQNLRVEQKKTITLSEKMSWIYTYTPNADNNVTFKIVKIGEL